MPSKAVGAVEETEEAAETAAVEAAAAATATATDLSDRNLCAFHRVTSKPPPRIL